MDLLEAVQKAGVRASELRWIEARERRIPYLEVPGAESLAAWQALRDALAATGHWPVLLGSVTDVEALADRLESSTGEPAQILAAAESLAELAGRFVDSGGRDRWLATELGLEAHELDDDEEVAEFETVLDETIAADAVPSTSLQTPLDVLSGLPHARVALALVPCREGWQVPAYLEFGGWNACPGAEAHVALHRLWNQRYGAEIVSLTLDVIECRVTRPPQDDGAALELARVQYAYCADIVEQGVETVGALAGALRGGSTWYFWWD